MLQKFKLIFHTISSTQKQFFIILTSLILLCLSISYCLFSSNTNFETPRHHLYFQTIDDLNEVIKSDFKFSLASFFLSLNFKNGLHKIPINSSCYDIIKELNTQPSKAVRIPIGDYHFRRGLTINVCKKLDIKSRALRRVLADSSNPEIKKQFTSENIYCLLIQDTIWEYENIRANELLNTLYDHWNSVWNKKRLLKAQELNLTPIEITILASIVKAETKYVSEMPKVAGLYLNRLRDSIRLQSDPTVVYANGQKPLRRIRSRHLKSQNPYNTYRHDGLPPGPVYTPTIEAIDAVLNHEKHDYFFFVSNPDLDGFHDFSKTYEEHKLKAKAYRRKITQKGIH